MGMERQETKVATTTAAAFNLAESGYGDRPDLDDDGREKRTGGCMSGVHG
jgi:hypothetical protein